MDDVFVFFGGFIAFLVGVALFIGAIFGVLSIGKNYSRHQHLQDAKNSVKITTIYVKRQQQEARRIAARDGVVHALADQRIIQARGIARAQSLISDTLTPLYVQFEAIQNQLHGGGEKIYIPVGPLGVPLVNNVGK